MPKILIISHNPLTTYASMGKTLTTLLMSFSGDEICQLYIYPTVPNVDKCSSYFRITDKDVLRSYYKFKVNGGEISPDSTQSRMFENADDEQIYRNPKNKKASVMLARDLMWKCARWYTKELRDWLDKQKPECILAAPGAAMFLYDIAMKVSKELNIPIISYLCDEYYFVQETGSFWRRNRLKLLKNKIEKYMSQTAHVITISDELKELYINKFHRPMTTVMTGSSFPIATGVHSVESPTAITYMGNVRCNRYLSIEELGKVLDEINREESTDYHIDVYTNEKDKQILAVLETVDTVNLCGFVSGEEFDYILHHSDFLLHVESFDNDYIELVRNSISTKLADSLGSGVPLIAYGPDCIASMRHLIRNNCAITITGKEELKDTIKRAFTDREFRNSKAMNGLKTAQKYHEPKICGDMARSIVEFVTANNRAEVR